jgi:hypothetical protein
VCWAIAFILNNWNVRWLDWSTFYQVTYNATWESCIELQGVNLVVGGFSLATDYLWVASVDKKIKTTVLTSTLTPAPTTLA